MKKFFDIRRSSLQQKMVLMVLLALIATVGVLALVSNLQNRMLVELVSETRAEQQQAISQVSRDTMNQVLTGTLTNATALQANVADNDFSEVVNDIFMLQTMAQSVFDNRELIDGSSARLPDPAKEGSPSAMVLCEEGVDYRSSTLLRLAATLSDPMIAMYQNSSKIDGLYIGLADGTDLCVDVSPASKLDEAGKPIPFPVRERPWYTGAVENAGLHFTGIMEDAFSGRLLVTCSAPVYSRGELVGVVGIDIVLESMTTFMKTTSDSGGSVLVVNEHGEVILSSEEEGLFAAAREDNINSLHDLGNDELSQFVELALHNDTELTEISLNGKEYFVAGSPMSTIGWAVISIIDKEITEQPEKLMLSEFDRINSDASVKFHAGSARTKQMVHISLAAVALLSIAFALFAAGRIVRPLEEMTVSVIESGESGEFFEMKDRFRTHDEIEVLAEAFDDLSKRTKHYIEDLTQITKQTERVNTELNVASQIQSSMLPHVFPPFPDRQEFDLYASMDPAKEVGGDFYDYFLIDEDHLGLVMADVSGKGVPAALFMMISMVILHNYAVIGKSPAEVLAMTNAALCSSNAAEMFVTVWLGVLEISTGKITAANAGHEFPALTRDGRFILFKDKHSFIIGGMDGVKYKQYDFQLQPGDRLFLYTDGVPEATDAQERMFGTERMLDALNEEPDAQPKRILENVRRAVDGFVKEAEQFDDLTMLCLAYRGPADKEGTDAKV